MNRSRHLLLTSASVLALSIASSGGAHADGYEPAGKGFAPPRPMRTISGTVGIYGAYNSVDLDRPDDDDQGITEDTVSIGGDARVDIPLSDMYSLQIDQYGEGVLTDDLTTSEDFAGGYLAGLHLTKRHANHYLFGVFGGGGKVYSGSTSDNAYTQWLLGVEGQYYHGNTTFYGQVGYVDTESNDDDGTDRHDLMANAYFLRGVVRHYMHGGNTKLEGELGWMSGENDVAGTVSTDDVDMIAWGLELEHLIRTYGDDGFLSFFARYQGQHYDEDVSPPDKATVHTVRVGIRMDLNQPNPLARERNGAAVDLPDMNRWLGGSKYVE